MLLPACATIVNGTSQAVAVSTSPPGAMCAVDRAGARIGVVPQTPGSLWVDKSKNNLTVTCEKAGFQTASVTHTPSFSVMTAGNVIAGGLIGIAVDAMSGANYEYPTDLRIELASSPGAGTPPYAPQAQQHDPRAACPVSQYSPPVRVLPVALASSPGAGTTPYVPRAPQQDTRASYPTGQYNLPAGVLPDTVALHAASY